MGRQDIVTLVAASIAALVSLIGIIVNIIFQYKNSKLQKEQFDARMQSEKKLSEKSSISKYITDKRIDWIYELRNTASQYIAASVKIADDKKYYGSIDLDLIKDSNITACKINLLLNFTDVLDKEILERINFINSYNQKAERYEEVKLNISLLTDLFEVYLK